jgi:hypothetical protein
MVVAKESRQKTLYYKRADVLGVDDPRPLGDLLSDALSR